MNPKKVEEEYLKMLKKAGGSRRVQMGFELYHLARGIIESAIRNEDPSLSRKEIVKRVNQRFLNHD